MIRSNVRHALALGLVLAAMATAASAHSAQEVELPARAMASSTSSAGPRPAFDWFANRRAAAPVANQAAIVRAADSIRLGGGSWICSPAGSGMRSFCVAR